MYHAQEVLDSELLSDESQKSSQQHDPGECSHVTVGMELGEDWMSQKQQQQMRTYMELSGCASPFAVNDSADSLDVREGSRPIHQSHANGEFQQETFRDDATYSIPSDHGAADLMMRDLSEDDKSISSLHSTHSRSKTDEEFSVDDISTNSNQGRLSASSSLSLSTTGRRHVAALDREQDAQETVQTQNASTEHRKREEMESDA